MEAQMSDRDPKKRSSSQQSLPQESVSATNSTVEPVETNISEVEATEQELSITADFWLYAGDINHEGYERFSVRLEDLKEKKEHVILCLTTNGGDPNAGFRIARALGHHYKKVTILISDRCKSAGTLICISAHQLVIGDMGELGPLDIQLNKPDEMFESSSGLDLIQSFMVLQNQTLDAFRNYLIEIRLGSQISTKLSSEIACKLAIGFVTPIAAQIDPIKLGEHQRAMSIAKRYGLSLDSKAHNLKSGMLDLLLTGYPSHSFVIDRKEAAAIFKNVKAPENDELTAYYVCRELLQFGKIKSHGVARIELLNQVIEAAKQESEEK
jgi:hypothetical protein